MDDSWQREQDLIADALEQSADERAAFLDEACAGDEPMRRRVERLLGMEGDATSFLETPPELPPEAVTDQVHSEVGGFVVRRRIASGGAGSVYEAVQERPHRTVALKLLRADVSTPALERRFERESEVLAHVHHPAIAHVYEAGVHVEGTSRQPYIAMELVRDASTIVGYAELHDLGIEERIKLFLDACNGIAHGHGLGIVHRDLKPSNILVDGQGHVKIIDFGVARVLPSADSQHDTIETRAGDVIGTLPYMSPEQCGGKPDDVDERADVYALGVLLFEMLTGRLPITLGGLSLDEAVRAIRTQPPARIARVAPTLAPELDAITAKALEKELDRRYESVGALSADLQRYLDHQPILARPPSILYQTRLFTRRHRTAVLAGCALLLTLIGGVVASTAFAIKANTAAAAEQTERTKAEDILNMLDRMLSSPDPHIEGEDVTVAAMLDHWVSDLDDQGTSSEDVEAHLRDVIGRTYFALAQHDKASVQLRRSAELYRNNNTRQFAYVMNTLGLAEQSAGRLDQAEAAFRESIAALESIPDDESIKRELYYGNFASLLITRGKFDEALPMTLATMEERKRLYSDDDIFVCVSLRELASIYERLDDFETAKSYRLEAIALASRITEESHPLRSSVIGEMANTLFNAKRAAEAVPYYEQAWELARTHRRPGSYDWIFSYDNLATGLLEIGEADRALEVLKHAVTILEDAVDPDDPDLAVARTRRAEVQQLISGSD